MLLHRAIVLALACSIGAGSSVVSSRALAQESGDLATDEEEPIDESADDTAEEEEAEPEPPPLKKPKPDLDKSIQKISTKTATASAPNPVRSTPRSQPQTKIVAQPIEEKPPAISESQLREHIEARARFLRAGDTSCSRRRS
jgi:hypothetical protein